jgi:hypothetical protein
MLPATLYLIMQGQFGDDGLTQTIPSWDQTKAWFSENGAQVPVTTKITYTNSDRTATSTSNAYINTMFVAHYRTRKSGKWYYEIKCTKTGNGASYGWASEGLTVPASVSGRYSFRVNGSQASLFGSEAGTSVSTASVSILVNDIVRFAVDIDAGKVWIAVNSGAWVKGGDPVLGTTPTLSGTLVNGRPAAYGLGSGGSSYNNSSFTIYSDSPNLNYACPSGFTAFGDASLPSLDYP